MVTDKCHVVVHSCHSRCHYPWSADCTTLGDVANPAKSVSSPSQGAPQKEW
jgi:hypothetical protein